jgi:nicotinate-nucleotide adenylyltransferase
VGRRGERLLNAPEGGEAPLRVGLFGGTFDPPHYGHLALAAAARDELALDQVLWVPAADPPHKQGRPISPAADRLAMVQAAIADQPGFELSRIDVDRPGPHWTADTVALLAEQYPGAELVFVMGGDSLRDLPTWGRPQEIVDCCILGVLRRPGDAVDLPSLEAVLPGVTAKVRFIDEPPIMISAHDIRERIRAGLPIWGLVPPLVAEIIARRGLYRDTAEA